MPGQGGAGLVTGETGWGRTWVRDLLVVWLALFVSIAGMSLVIPFLPLYLKDLGVPESQMRLWAGWVGGANFLFAAAFAPIWGSLADRYGRKLMALRALVGLAVSVGLMGFAQDVYQLLALRFLQGIFGGFVGASIALVGVSVPRERLGSSLGLLQTAVVTGNMIGPLLGGELSHHFGHRATFRITGAALVVATLLVWFLVRERHARREGEEPRGMASGIRELLGLPTLRWMALVVLLSHAGMMLVNPQLSLFVRDLAGPGQSVERWAGIVTAAPALTSVLMAPLWGRAGDRKGHALVLTAALLGAALSVVWAAPASVIWQLIVVRLAMGAFTSALNPSAHSVVAHCVPEHRTAGAFSLVGSAQMLGACVGPFLGGPAATAWGVRPLFVVTAALLLAACFGAGRVWLRTRTAQEERLSPA